MAGQTAKPAELVLSDRGSAALTLDGSSPISFDGPTYHAFSRLGGSARGSFPALHPGDPDEAGLSLHLQHEDERRYGWIGVDRSDNETYAYAPGVYADFERQPN